ncbi:MAG: hypothetical protein CVU20_01605 [Betaproteobacteria bacterium HGW-Betaproteobacteria-14]|nr:MAG: hypothetical protein CVU20_01605 [Betaproteobacteria bacterium HGW-Betaproteobacteria-14]
MLPLVPWLGLLAAAALLFLAAAAAMELRLDALGYQPTARDSQERWQAARARAARLGERALILVGASRFQLGLDLDVLRRETGLEPVQLALDGSGGEPILEGLANDTAIRGTVLVEYYDHTVGARGGVAEHMQRQYGKSADRLRFWKQPAERVEARLTAWLHERLRAYSDGANPLASLRWRILPAAEARQYLVTRPDRSRLADYTRVDMPDFYYRRVARTLGEEIDVKAPGIEAALAQRIAALAPVDDAGFRQAAREVGRLAEKIRARGGQVIFIAMPSSGLVREIEARRYPRERFWERFQQEAGVTGLHAAYEPGLTGFSCPDGSHLDMRDRAAFSKALAAALSRHKYSASVIKQ